MIKKNSSGFTLMEIMVSLSIMALLSGIVISGLDVAKKRSRMAQRISDLKQIQNSLELYYSNNKIYPISSGSALSSECNAWGGLSGVNVIPGLFPAYSNTMPKDPQMDKTTNTNCYVYRSDGQDYAFIDVNVTELSSGSPNFNSYPELVDPARDGGSNPNIVDGTNITAWKVSSRGGRSW